MYIVNNESDYSRWEVDTLEDLIIELTEQNLKNKVRDKEEKLTIYKVDENKEILDETTVTLPTTEKEIESIFSDLTEEENYLEGRESDLTEEEENIFNKLNNNEEVPTKTYKVKQKQIREQLEQKRLVEEKVPNKKQFSERENYNRKQEIQVQANKNDYSQPAVYEGMTIMSADELKNQFVIKTQYELDKIEQQIYILEKQAREYRKLIKVINDTNY